MKNGKQYRMRFIWLYRFINTIKDLDYLKDWIQQRKGG